MIDLIRQFEADQMPWQQHPTRSLLMKVFEDRASGFGYDAVLVNVLPGNQIDWHFHAEASETIYVLQGSAQILAATSESDRGSAQKSDLGSGSVVTIPIGIHHSVINTSMESLLIFAFHSPATL